MTDILMKPIVSASKEFAKIYPNVEHQVDLMVSMNNKVHPESENIKLNEIDYLNAELQHLYVNP